MSDETLPAAPNPEPWHRRVPARTMAIWLVLIAVVFLTRGGWEAWVEDYVLPVRGSPPHTASSDGRKIVVEHGKGLTLWNVEDGREIATLPAELDGQRQFFAGGSRLFVMPVSGGEGTGGEPAPTVRRTPIVFDAGTGKRLFELAAGARPAGRASFSRDDRIFVSYVNGTNRIWNGVTGEVIADLQPPCSVYGWCTRFSFDGNQMVTFGRDGKAHVWDANTGRQVGGFGGHGQTSFAVLTRTGKRIVVGSVLSGSATCRILDIASGDCVASMEVEPRPGGVTVSAVSRDGALLAGFHRGKVFIADAESGKMLHAFQAPHRVTCLWFSRGAGFLFANDFWGSPRWGSVWNVRTGKCIFTSSDALLLARFTPDESRFVRQAEPSAMEMRSVGTREVLLKIPQVKGFQVLNDNAVVIWRDIGDIRVWRRLRPERWWGIAWLPHFWMIAALSLALVWSVRRDTVQLRRSREDKGGAQA